MTVVKIIEKDADFEPYIQQNQFVLAVFSAIWCSPCRALDPIVEKIAQDYKGRVSVCKIEVDVCPATTKKYGIRSVPTSIIFENGKKSATIDGLASREEIIECLGI
ncbi:hypothetical protein CYY_010001 [Polysphondylium violaceum]|uniref:Thioredoxin n=1 Tax=Polysphondylium violaceum TaxID=133409 RepID=A0A8J4PKH4_9MYCE|nr:hypothetical protein CYY_010001 [Polysphondylium violaceum]